MTISKSSAVHEIERIVDHRDKSPHLDSKTGRMIRDREYLIKWKKYDHSYNTWEPYNTIKQDAPDSVHLYEETQKSKRIENKRKLLKQQKEEALAKKKKQEQENLKEAKNVLKDDITLKPILVEVWHRNAIAMDFRNLLQYTQFTVWRYRGYLSNIGLNRNQTNLHL